MTNWKVADSFNNPNQVNEIMGYIFEKKKNKRIK